MKKIIQLFSTFFMEISKLWCLDCHQKAKKFKYQRNLLSPECVVELVEYKYITHVTPISVQSQEISGWKKNCLFMPNYIPLSQ